METLSNHLKLAEIKKQNLRKTMDSLHDHASSVLFLTLQWKELETHFDSSLDYIKEREKGLLSIQSSIENNFEELKSRENKFGLAQESIRERFEELEVKERRLGLVQGDIEERLREVERKEREFEAKQKVEIEERCREIERVRRELEIVQRSIEESLREIGVKEKKFKVFNGSIEEKSKDLLEIQELINTRFREIEVREKGLEECLRDFEAKEKRLEEKLQEMELAERQFDESWLELEWREKGIEEKCEEIELKDKEGCFHELKLKEKQVEGFYQGLKRKEKQLEEWFKEFEGRDKQFEERRNESELHDKQFEEEWSKKLELKFKNDEELEEQYEGRKSKEKQNEGRVKELVMKEKKFASASKINIDGNNLQMNLLQHWEEHDSTSMKNEVFEGLKLSSNPAKLVLEAIQGFYPPRSEEIGGQKFKEKVLRKSCILLLEQLMKVSPDIKPKVKEEAMELASDWFKKMKTGSGSLLEVLGFLQLLASYGLASVFDADKLLKLLENVAQHSQALELWRGLGFTDKIPGFIETLITNKQHLEAIRYIYAFKLIDKFPPVPLLESYMKHIDKVAEKCYNKGNKSLKEQNQAINKILHDMRAIVRCIEDHKLESECSPQYLKRQIASLEKLIANNEKTLPVLGCKVQPQEQSVKKCIAPTISGAASPAPVSQSQQQKGSKRPWTAVLAENDPVGAKSADQDFIQNLIDKEKQLEAIRQIFALDLVDKFPPIPLLKDYLQYSKKKAEEFCKKKNYLLAVKMIDKELAALKAVIKCIVDYKLEAEYSPKILEERIALLENWKKLTSEAPSFASVASSLYIPQPQQQNEKKRPRIALSTEAPLNTIHLGRPPHQPPAGFSMINGAPYLNTSGTGFPPNNWQMSSYPNNINPY